MVFEVEILVLVAEREDGRSSELFASCVGGGSALSDNIATLCSQSPAVAADFDGRVRGLLQEVYARGSSRESC